MKPHLVRPKRQPRAARIEILESRIAPASLASFSNGSIQVIGDQGGAGQVERLVVSISGPDLHITDPLGLITAGNGFTQNGSNDVSIALSALTGDFVINTGTGGDTVDFTTSISLPGALNVTSGTISSPIASSIVLGTGQTLAINARGPVTLNGPVSVPGTMAVTFTTANSLAVPNAGNDLGTVSVSGATGVTLRDDTGFTLGPINATSSVTVQSNALISQTAAISGTTGLTKLGSGQLILSLTNTYTGATQVNAGVLVVSGSIADGSPATDVTIASGAVLAGNGTIGGTVSNSGTVRPGGAGGIAKLTISGSYTQTTGGLLDLEIAGAAAGQADQLAVGGLAALAGTVKASGINGFTPSGLETYTLLTHGARNGTFETVDKPPGSAVNYQASSTTLVFNTDLIVNGTGGDDTLMLTTQGAPGYSLNGGPFVPLGAVPGFVFNGGSGNDTFTVDLRSGNPIPAANGVTFNGQAESAGGDDQLKIIGGTQGNVQYTFDNAHDGLVAMANFGTVKFTGIGPLINSGGQTDLVFNLPTTGGNNADLGDDGTALNGLSRLSGATIPTVDFADPTNSLSINRGTATDFLTIHALPDFDRALTAGMSTARFASVSVQGAISLSGGSDFSLHANSVQFGSAQADVLLGGTGSMLIDATGPVSFQSGSSVETAQGGITIISTGSQLMFDTANLTTGGGGINLNGRGDATLGEGILLQATTVNVGGGGTLTVAGTGGSNPSAPNHGVHLTSNSVLAAEGTLTVTGVAGGTAAGANAIGVLVESAAAIVGDAATMVSGTGGIGSGGLNHGVALVGALARIAAAGVLQLSGTAGAGSGGVDVKLGAGTALDGSGTVTGNLVSDGTIRPGGPAAVGKLTVSGSYTQTGGTLEIDLGGTGAGQFDVLAVGNASMLGGLLIAQPLAGFSVAVADSFVIVERAGTAASPDSFSGQGEGTTFSFNGVTKRLTYVGGNGHDVALVAPAGGTTLEASLNAGVLTISDLSSTGRNNLITVVRNGADLLITDLTETFVSALAGGALSNGDHTMSIPFSLLTGALVFNTADGQDLLTIDLTGGNVIPLGGLTFTGGNPAVFPGDRLTIKGGSQGTVTYNYTNAHDGSVAMSNFGTVSYTGLEPISNSGSATDIIFNLPAAANNAVLADDATPGNGLSILFGANFEQTSFANPTGSLTINRGSATDSLTINALPDFDASLAFGTAANPFASVTFTGAVTLADNHSLNVFSAALGLTGSAALDVTATGSLTFAADAMALAGTMAGISITLQPLTAGIRIDLGGADSPGTLGLSAIELSHVTSFGLTIGSAQTGPIAITDEVKPTDHLTLISGAGISGAGAVTLSVNRDLTLQAIGLINLTGKITAPNGLFLDSVGDITLTNPANTLNGVHVLNGGTVSLRDDGGFDIVSSNVSKLLALESAGPITQTNPMVGAGGLTKAGAGTLTLQAANTFAGATTIAGGVLILEHADAVQNSTVIVARDGSLKFGAATTYTLGGLTGGGDIKLSNAGDAAIDFRVGNNNADTTYAGNLSGAGQLDKIGTGRLTLTGQNSQLGGTRLHEGALFVGRDSALGAKGTTLSVDTASTLHATATFAITRSIHLGDGIETFEAASGKTLTLAGVISGPGSLRLGPTGRVEITNPKNTNSGPSELDSSASTVINGVTISAPGAKGKIVVTPGMAPNSIALVDLSGVTTPTRLVITGPKGVPIQVDRIINNDATDLITSIVLGKTVTFGSGDLDALADLEIAGKLGKLQLSDVKANSIITLGKGLAYLDTYKNKPNVTLGNVLGGGVVLDVTGDGVTAGGIGGGGLGKVLVNTWSAPGVIKTTQSIRSITIKQGGFNGQVLVDPNHLGEATVANVGSVSIPGGAWGGSGMTVEGVVAKFLTQGLIDGTSISAGAFGPVTINGNFDGSVFATFDANVTSTVKGKTTVAATGNIGAVSILGDFTGLISGDGKVGNVTLRGSADFRGTLHGGTLGNITAASFTGTPTGPDPRESITSATSIGAIKATTSTLTDYLIAAGTSFGPDGRADGVNDVYTSTYASGTKTMAVKIGAITIKGAVVGTTIAAGIDPGVDNSGLTPVYGVYGDGIGDALIPLPLGTIGTTSIGLMKFQTSGTATLTLAGGTSLPIVNAFFAQAITGLQFGTTKATLSGTAQYIDSGGTSIKVQLLA